MYEDDIMCGEMRLLRLLRRGGGGLYKPPYGMGGYC